MQTGEFRVINRGFVKQQLLFMSSLLADSKFLAENKLTYTEAIEEEAAHVRDGRVRRVLLADVGSEIRCAVAVGHGGREGDHVEEGQLIARIDRDMQEPQLHQAQLRAAQAQLNQATTAANLAAKDEARYRALLEAGAVSVQTYDTYKSQLDNALAAEDAARAAVDAANADLLKNDQNLAAQRAAQEQAAALQSQLDAVNVNIDETEIRAPFDGIITQKYVEEGQLISSAIPIFALQNPLDNWIDFKVDETAINKFSIGQSIKVRGRDGSTVIDGTVESADGRLVDQHRLQFVSVIRDADRERRRRLTFDARQGRGVRLDGSRDDAACDRERVLHGRDDWIDQTC